MSVDPFPCGAADPTCETRNVQSRVGVPFSQPMDCGPALVACQLMYDVFWLPGRSNVPVVVMVPGGPLPPGNRHSMWGLARHVAAHGAVVLVADYRSSASYGGGYPETFADVGCAIATARVAATEFGGNGRTVTLVSHSFGGFPSAVVAATTGDLAIPGCMVTGERTRPDAFVGVAGVYLPEHIGELFLSELLGGTHDTASDAWEAVDVAVLATGSASRPIPVALVLGELDPVGRPEHASALAEALSPWDTDVPVRMVPGANHDTVLTAPITVDTVVDTMERAEGR